MAFTTIIVEFSFWYRQDENLKLKKLLAESMLDQAALKELLANTPSHEAAPEIAVAQLPLKVVL